MARRNEEIDDDSGSDNGTTVMVGGMDSLVPGGKDDDLEVEIEAPKPPVEREAKKPVERQASGDDDDERDEDARLAYDTGDDDEIEERGLSRRQRRNRTRKTVVAGRDQVIDALNAKVEALTSMVGQMGQSQVGLTVNTLDTQLGAAQQALTLADVEIKKAVAAGDLGRYDELQSLKQEAQQRVWQLSRHRQAIQQDLQSGGRTRQLQPAPNGTTQVSQSNGLNQRATDFTATFMDRFDFDPTATDEQTLIIKAIDDSVAAEGYRADTPMYWRTLEKKLAARGIYPADDGNDDDDGRERTREREPVRRANGGRPPTAGGRGPRRGTGGTFRLDPMMRDYLEGEGILHLDGLDDSQKARRGRLLKQWQDGTRKAARGGAAG